MFDFESLDAQFDADARAKTTARQRCDNVIRFSSLWGGPRVGRAARYAAPYNLGWRVARLFGARAPRDAVVQVPGVIEAPCNLVWRVARLFGARAPGDAVVQVLRKLLGCAVCVKFRDVRMLSVCENTKRRRGLASREYGE